MGDQELSGQGQETPSGQAGQEGNPGQAAPAQNVGLSFIPAEYKDASWASKYSTPEDFFKGIDNLNKMVGQKQIVQGIQVPGEGATDDDWSKYYTSLGRPESADKYNLPEDVKAFDGFDLDGEKKMFNELAHKNGLSDKQAAGLFKDYIGALNKHHEQYQASRPTLDQAKKEAFGDKVDEGYALANKASDAYGYTDKLNARGLGRDPLVLQILAELGKGVGEGEFVPNNGGESKESLLEQARRLQASPEYKTDQKVFDQVASLYKQANALKK